MAVVVTGSRGLVGSALVPFLKDRGFEVTQLLRGTLGRAGTASWDPIRGSFFGGALDQANAVVHLAGESIAGGRWTPARKARIRDSRVIGTRHLCEALANLTSPPRVLVAASALGFYGDRGDALLDESSESGEGFLPTLCREWEAATQPALERGIRVVHLRIGIVLSPNGGALAKMLPPFRLGIAGSLGSGEQYLSWILLDDLLEILLHTLTSESLSGPVNAVAPGAVTNQEFTKTLGRVLRRPTVFPMPEFAARLVFGEMADSLLLASTRVHPMRLLTNGFEFAYPELEDALRHTLGRMTT